jgi:beta-lactamase class A
MELLVNGDEVFPIASSIKIAILIEFFKKIESGEINPEELLTLRKSHKVGGSGVLTELNEDFVTMPLIDYAMLMITVSDNVATNICIDLVGMKEINRTLTELGLNETRITRKMMDLKSLEAGNENISTPRDLIKLMRCLHHKNGLSSMVCKGTLDVLKRRKQGLIEGVIRNSVPNEILVANKSGWLDGATCDVGIVYLLNRPYAVAILTKHIPSKDPKRLKAIKLMTKVTGIIHDYFQEVDQSTPYGRRFTTQSA